MNEDIGEGCGCLLIAIAFLIVLGGLNFGDRLIGILEKVVLR